MRIPLLVCLILCAAAITCGCTFPQKEPAAPVPYESLTELIPAEREMPFPVAYSVGKELTRDDMGSIKGVYITRGYTRIYTDTSNERSARNAFILVIVESDSQNVSSVYTAFKALVTSQETDSLTMPLPDPGIGDQSMAVGGVQPTSGFTQPIIAILFQKGNIVGVAEYMSMPPDYGKAKELALLAANRIPVRGATVPQTTPDRATRSPTRTSTPVTSSFTSAAAVTKLSLQTAALMVSDMPFTVRSEQSQTVGLTVDRNSSEDFGLIRGFTKGYSNQEEGAGGSTNATVVIQTILEYPKGNATRALAKLRTDIGSEKTTAYTLLNDPKICDESFSAVARDSSSKLMRNPITVAVFRKGDYLETIAVSTETPATPLAADLARTACKKL